MQIVIDIPEEEYAAICYNVRNEREYSYGYVAIANGKPLPKGHGDLKDMGKIVLNKFTDTEVYSLSLSSRFSTDYKRGYNDAINDVAYVLVKAPTVVEADKEAGE